MHTHIVEIALEHSNSQRGKGLKIAQGLPLILGPTEDSYETSSIMLCISTLLGLLRLKLQTGHGIAISKDKKKEEMSPPRASDKPSATATAVFPTKLTILSSIWAEGGSPI
jgi:hypothetical protein